MLEFPQINPIALSLGPVNVHWYGLMYVIAFIVGWMLLRYRASRSGSDWTHVEVNDIVSWVMLGAILGGRVGYVLFYDLAYYMQHPIEILYVWNGGMSFHGGLIGVLIVLFAWGIVYKRRFLETLDFIAPAIAPGLFFGRIGNFINAELWGKTTDVSWGMIFPNAGILPRHPTQLYEAGLEGIALFLIVWIFSAKERPEGAVSGLFALLYGTFRIFNEFFREPDAHLGYLYGDWFTMGMLLSLPLIIVGILLIVYSFFQKKSPSREKIVLKDGSVVWIKNK